MSVMSITSAPKATNPSPDEIIPSLIGVTIREVERQLVLHTLKRCDGNRTRAARVLGISVRTLRNKIREYSGSGCNVPSTFAKDRSSRDHSTPGTQRLADGPQF